MLYLVLPIRLLYSKTAKETFNASKNGNLISGTTQLFYEVRS